MPVAEHFAPATFWLTTTQRWQRSGTGRPEKKKGVPRTWQQAAPLRRPGGVASVGMKGAPAC